MVWYANTGVFAYLSSMDSDLNFGFLSLQGLCAEAQG